MKVSIPSGFKIGHYDDDFTGVSVILASDGAVGGVDCRGGAPGTRETDLLHNEKMMQKINAVVLSGGSAYGLASTVGVKPMCGSSDSGITPTSVSFFGNSPVKRRADNTSARPS